ncbi:hypothetical protein ACSSS7_005587 [Eimeria intestinalis]
MITKCPGIPLVGERRKTLETCTHRVHCVFIRLPTVAENNIHPPLQKSIRVLALAAAAGTTAATAAATATPTAATPQAATTTTAATAAAFELYMHRQLQHSTVVVRRPRLASVFLSCVQQAVLLLLLLLLLLLSVHPAAAATAAAAGLVISWPRDPLRAASKRGFSSCASLQVQHQQQQQQQKQEQQQQQRQQSNTSRSTSSSSSSSSGQQKATGAP